MILSLVKPIEILVVLKLVNPVSFTLRDPQTVEKATKSVTCYIMMAFDPKNLHLIIGLI